MWTRGVRRVLIMYKLYTVGTSTEPCGTPDSIPLGVDSSLSTEILNFLLLRYELMVFVQFAANCNFDILCSKPGCHEVSKLSQCPKYRNCGHEIVEVKGYMVHEPHAMKCLAVTRTETKLTCIQQVISV
jgi:hypothetical protein